MQPGRLITFGATPAAANGCITPAAGTAGDPFLIQDEGNLECLRDNGSYYWHHGYHFKQAADLDLSAGVWSNGIGDDSDTFNGTYDGNGFVINALRLTDDTMVGLFGATEGATLQDITLTNVVVTSTGVIVATTSSLTGGLVGTARSNTTITDSSVSGSVQGAYAAIGGLVGEASRGEYGNGHRTILVFGVHLAHGFRALHLLRGPRRKNGHQHRRPDDHRFVCHW